MGQAHILGAAMVALVWVVLGTIVVSLALVGYAVVDFIRWSRLLDKSDEL